VNDLMAR